MDVIYNFQKINVQKSSLICTTPNYVVEASKKYGCTNTTHTYTTSHLPPSLPRSFILFKNVLPFCVSSSDAGLCVCNVTDYNQSLCDLIQQS